MAGGGGREEAPWDSPHTPHTLPPVPPSPTVPARAPAGRSPGSEDVSRHPRPANSKKCERWGVGGGGGKAEAGSLPSLWKSKELPSSQRPCWYPDHPPPHQPPPSGGNFVFRVSLHLYLYLCPARSPTFPRLQRPGCLCSGHPHSAPLPILIPSCVSQPPTTFCVVLHGFAVNGESGNPAVPELVPRRQAD